MAFSQKAQPRQSPRGRVVLYASAQAKSIGKRSPSAPRGTRRALSGATSSDEILPRVQLFFHPSDQGHDDADHAKNGHQTRRHEVTSPDKSGDKSSGQEGRDDQSQHQAWNQIPRKQPRRDQQENSKNLSCNNRGSAAGLYVSDHTSHDCEQAKNDEVNLGSSNHPLIVNLHRSFCLGGLRRGKSLS